MLGKRIALLRQILLFVLVTLLGIATGFLTNEQHPPAVLGTLERAALPLAGLTAVVIVAVMIWQQVADERVAAAPAWDSGRPPFPGLEAFTEQDAGVFFGRAAESSELLDRLHPAGGIRVNRLIAVIGPSGAGKSSLVSAGLLPRLGQRRHNWIVVPSFVPEERPVRSLARSLAAAGCGGPADAIVARLRAGPRGLADCLEEVRAAAGGRSSSVLITVDQGEELLTLAGDEERDEFLQLLENGLEADARLWIIFVMRSEFLTPLLATSHARLFRDPVTVGALGRAALYEVIARPAAQAGLRFDPPELVQQMVDDAGGGDALPLLAFALQELYLDAGKTRVATAGAYRRLNGVTGALTRQADKVAAELESGRPGSPVLAALLNFVALGDSGPTRRRVSRSALDADAQRVVDAFVAARLLVAGASADGGDAVIEVAHEALFRHWAPLRQEIEAHTEELRWRADLDRWAHDWERSGRQDSYLLRADRLGTARQLAAAADDLQAATPLVTEFLDRSNQADRAAREQLSETIARQALGEIEQDPEHSLRLALAAVDECAPTPLAQHALTAALSASRLRGVLHGHEHAVTSADWSPDGRRIATSSADKTARIWDAATREQLLILRGHDDEVRAATWSPDSTRLATTSADRSARIWDAATGVQQLVLHGHAESGWGIAWSPAGDRVATSSNDRTTRIWDAVTGEELVVLRGHEHHTERAAWSPDGKRIATVSSDLTVRVWDTANGTQLMVLTGHTLSVRGVSWSPDGTRIASSSNDRSVRIWDASDGTELMNLHGHSETVGAVSWSPDGTRLASSSTDRTVRIWDAARGTAIVTIRGRYLSPFRVSWSPDGQQVVTASDERTAEIWEAGDDLELAVFRGHDDGLRELAWAPDGRRVATASDDRTARIWHANSGTELRVLRGHDMAVRSVAWSPGGRLIATGSADRTALIWDLASAGAHPLELRGHDLGLWTVAWSPGGDRLATGSIDGTARIWDARTGAELVTLTGHDGGIRQVSWSPDGRRVATASNDRTGRIWDSGSGAVVLILRGHDLPVRVAAWSPDGRRIVTGADDGRALVWDAVRGTQLLVLEGHEGWVMSAGWSPPGDRIATASADGTVRVWSAETGSQLIVAGVHMERAEAVAWSPDGSRLASASRDGTARIWDATLRLADLTAMARERIQRPLSGDERRSLMLAAEYPAVGT